MGREMTTLFNKDSFPLPSRAQVALALAIVKSKPLNATIQDHLLEIRRHIHQGRKQPPDTTPDKHLDSTAFWRQAYEKSESAQSGLLDRIYDLELRNELLLLRVTHDQHLESKAPPKRKAKSDDDAPIPTTSQKRTRVKGGQPRGSKLGPQDLGHDEFHLDLSEGTTISLMRHFHALQRLLQKRSNPEYLAIAVSELCKAANKAIGSAIENEKGSMTPPNRRILSRRQDPGLQCVLFAMGRFYPSLLEALKKASNVVGASGSAGLITYQITWLFKMTLGHLHQYTLSKVKGELTREKPPNRKARHNTRAKTAKSAIPMAASLSVEEPRVLNYFSRLLTSMILSLDPSKDEQNNVLDGFMCSILEDVGKTLSIFIFRDLYSNPDLRLDSANLPTPVPLAGKHIDEVGMAAIERAAECESNLLVWILERAMALIRQHDERASVSSNVPPPTPKFSPAAGLFERSRIRLQNTLLKSVFGTDDQKFRDSLHPPEAPEAKIADMPAEWPGACPGKDIGQWFSQEVWRLLGWDVLLGGKGY